MLHVAKLTSIADYFVLCSGESERQVRAIADSIDETLSTQHLPPLGTEGGPTAKWIVMDFGDVVVHIFHQAVRDHYGLEKLWADATRVRLPAGASAAPVKARAGSTKSRASRAGR
ncbi:ribosomal silencing factor RsfS [Nitrospira sp.]|nr:ribosomal silencing factor RsfS [Nitrospira sp.]